MLSSWPPRPPPVNATVARPLRAANSADVSPARPPPTTAMSQSTRQLPPVVDQDGCELAAVGLAREDPPGRLGLAADDHDLDVVGSEHLDQLVWPSCQPRRVRLHPGHRQRPHERL